MKITCSINLVSCIHYAKFSFRYGCPSMEVLEGFSQEYKKRLDEVGASGQIPDDLALEVIEWLASSLWSLLRQAQALVG